MHLFRRVKCTYLKSKAAIDCFKFSEFFVRLSFLSYFIEIKLKEYVLQDNFTANGVIAILLSTTTKLVLKDMGKNHGHKTQKASTVCIIVWHIVHMSSFCQYE